MEQLILPDAINLEEDAVVFLWEDAHRSPFPHRYLRLRCPCANCIDEMSGKRTLDPDTVPKDVRAVDQMPVGKYGVQFLWSDTHYTGIYTFKVLRAACPCIICGEARAKAEKEEGGLAHQASSQGPWRAGYLWSAWASPRTP